MCYIYMFRYIIIHLKEKYKNKELNRRLFWNVGSTCMLVCTLDTIDSLSTICSLKQERATLQEMQ
jgi:lipid-A-disaccharide synthase-like uncharacterized protein